MVSPSPLTPLLRDGARKRRAKAVEAELKTFLAGVRARCGVEFTGRADPAVYAGMVFGGVV
jgi:hypothetical protein